MVVREGMSDGVAWRMGMGSVVVVVGMVWFGCL